FYESDSEMPLPQPIDQHSCEERVLGMNHPFDEALSCTGCETLSFARWWRDVKSILPDMKHSADLILGPVGLSCVENEALLLRQLFIFTDRPKGFGLCWLRQTQKGRSQTVVNPDLFRCHDLLVLRGINAN